MVKELSKVSGYIINIQNSIAFIDTNNDQLEEIMVRKPHL